MTSQENEFLEIIRTMKERILRVCYNYGNAQYTRDDLFQEVMYNLWKSYPSFRGESSRETWVFRITLYTCMHHYRRIKRNENTLRDLPDHTYESDVEQLEKENALHQAVRNLEEPDRAIMILYLEDRSYEEIAAIVGISVSNTGVRINRAKQKIKKTLENDGNR